MSSRSGRGGAGRHGARSAVIFSFTAHVKYLSLKPNDGGRVSANDSVDRSCGGEAADTGPFKGSCQLPTSHNAKT
ncbi:hypothetical protein EYF80_046727 [Liparis tanakae]|uniref:Uncharacterized protein n=1 Tax=Liparis tanakae TaxID=230148 RepID=A0A4Z2FQL6_9TELE|nr:hypothetical protein EYF80_046727 [Liparis tanakae]